MSTKFRGASGLTLVADLFGQPTGRTVLLLHGGGQNRHSWRSTCQVLAGTGLHVVALDSRGHGDSEWSPSGAYSLSDLAADVLEVLDQLPGPAVVVGASMGGLTGLLAAEAAGPPRVSGLVLVDAVPTFEKSGSARIRRFMQAAPEGFASLDEAAVAVTAYLPHRAKPRSVEGLRRNLRRSEDGRWRWHWDPRMMSGPVDDPTVRLENLESAARGLKVPVLLVHGQLSDVVTTRGIDELRRWAPHLEVLTLPHVGHTAAGDDNDAFTEILLSWSGWRAT